MTDREGRVRELAYFLWLDQGCPDGEAERHWQAAEILFESEPLERKGREGEPPGDPETAAAPAHSSAGPTALRRRTAASGKGD